MEKYVRAKGTINRAWDDEIDIKAVIAMIVSRGVCDLEDITALNAYITEQKKEKGTTDKFVQIVETVDKLTELVKKTTEKNESLKNSTAVNFSELREKVENIEEWIDEKEIELKKAIKGKGEENG